MKNILIVTDLEGMPNITSLSDSGVCETYFDEICKLSKWVENMGFQPYICDVHNSGKSLEGKKIENVTIYRGISGIDFSVLYDSAVLAGFHGMAGHEGVWTHTFTGEIEKAFLGDFEAGEITFFCNWLFLKGVGISAILGAHGIEEEAISMNIPYYIVSNRIEQENDMRDYILRMIKSKACCGNNIEDTIRIKLRNEEVEKILQTKASYIVEDGFVYFNNLDELVYSIEDLCISINLIKKQIVSRNIDFVKNIKRKYTAEVLERLRGISLLDKGLDELKEEDLLSIQQIIEDEDYKKFA